MLTIVNDPLYVSIKWAIQWKCNIQVAVLSVLQPVSPGMEPTAFGLSLDDESKTIFPMILYSDTPLHQIIYGNSWNVLALVNYFADKRLQQSMLCLIDRVMCMSGIFFFKIHVWSCYFIRLSAYSPGALEFDPGKNSTKLIFSGYVQNINRNKISKVPKFPPCAKFFTAIFQNGRVFGRK